MRHQRDVFERRLESIRDALIAVFKSASADYFYGIVLASDLYGVGLSVLSVVFL